MDEHRAPRDAALWHFDSGFNCAESINLAFPSANREVSRAGQMSATAFGGGLVRRGLLCGALAGAAMVLGRELGRDRADDADGKERVYAAVEEILREVESRFGAIDCRTLTGVDFHLPHDPGEMKALHERVCNPLVALVADLVAVRLARTASSEATS